MLRLKLRDDRKQVAELEAALGDATRAQESIVRLKAELVTVEKAAALERAAWAIFREAQRAVAERGLARIGQRANAMLAEAGIDLSVSFHWTEKGQGLASVCASCGAACPASVRVKRCERCGAERGTKAHRKLILGLSDRSGATEDMIGLALQLAAWQWIRADRGSGWSCALLDEPFAHTDKAVRRGMAGALPRLLAAGGIEQSIVVSHTADALHACQGTIRVASDGRASTLLIA